VLGWDPTVETRTGIDVDELTPSQQAALEEGAAEGSRDEAEAFVVRLENTITTTTTSTTTTTTTTTTRPRTTTTTTPRPPTTPAP